MVRVSKISELPSFRFRANSAIRAAGPRAGPNLRKARDLLGRNWRRIDGNLTGSILRKANLTGTNLQDVDLTTTTLTLANLSEAKNVKLKYPKRDAR